MKAEKISATCAPGQRILRFALFGFIRRFLRGMELPKYWFGSFFAPALQWRRITGRRAERNRILISSINWKAVYRNSTRLICGWSCWEMPAQYSRHESNRCVSKSTS